MVAAPAGLVSRPRGRAPRGGLRWAAEAHAGVSYRAAGSFSGEVGAAFQLWHLFVRAAYRPPSEWSLGVRPVEIQSISLVAGLRPRLLRVGRRWSLEPLVGLSVEPVALRRRDVGEATARWICDLGLALGGALLRELPGGLRTGALVETDFFFTGRRAAIPDGPSERLNSISVQVALLLAWGSL